MVRHLLCLILILPALACSKGGEVTRVADGSTEPADNIVPRKELSSDWIPQAGNFITGWHFNGDGSTMAGANSLTANGSPTYTASNIVGSNGVEFHGSEYFAVPREKDYGAMTVSAWVRVDSISGSAPIFSRMNGHVWYPRLNVQANGSINWQYRLGGGTLLASTPAGSVTLGQWVHIAATLSPSGGGKIYVNGVLAGSNATSGTFISGSTNTMLIGRDDDLVTNLSGAIDDAGIWDIVLTADEILSIYNAQVPL